MRSNLEFPMRTIRFLIYIAVLTLATVSSSGQSDQALIDRYDRMYAAEKYELALKAAELICERYPESATWHFNAGALCAKLGRPDNAIAHLRTCADQGYTGIASFEQNSDLDPVRDRDEFKAIIEQVRTAAKTRMDAFQREARAHQPQSYIPPSTPNEKRPLIIALHGTGMDGESMFDALQETAAAQDMILVCPDAMRPSGNGFAWTYRDESEWFVNHLIDEAIRKHNADPERVILVGFSQGANIALIMGQTHADRFLGVIPICGHYEPQVAKGEQRIAPFYLLTGARDPWKQTYSVARRAFTDAGAPVQLRMLPGRGHELPTGVSGVREYTKALLWVLDQHP